MKKSFIKIGAIANVVFGGRTEQVQNDINSCPLALPNFSMWDKLYMLHQSIVKL